MFFCLMRITDWNSDEIIHNSYLFALYALWQAVLEKFELRRDKFKTEPLEISIVQKRFCAYQDIGVDISECIGKRCTRQPAPTVGTNVKSPSSRTEVDQFIAESAMQNEGHHADIRLVV